ncbi:MAG: Asp-tRNA(Asn)/Glu-tRNA(Gln) amidotransferase subunit GatC [Roseburia sp.]
MKTEASGTAAYAPKNVISDETIEYVGILAKLELSEEEKEQAKKDMGAMLDYIDKLNELDTTGVEPMSHVFPVNNVFREDVVTNGDGSEDTLANAPLKKDGGFKVPKTIG